MQKNGILLKHFGNFVKTFCSSFDTNRMVKRKQLANKEAEQTWNTTYRSGYNKTDVLQENQASLEVITILMSHKL